MILRTKVVSRQYVPRIRDDQSLIHRILFFLKHCKSIKLVQQIHARMLTSSIQMPMHNYLLSKIIDLKDFGYSTLFFSQMPINSYAYNVMIRGLATTWQKFDLALEYFFQMKSFGVKPDNYTYPFVFISCGNLLGSRMGSVVHGEVMRTGLLLDLHTVHSLITMYSRRKEMVSAQKVFDEMTERDLVSWNSLISGYERLGFAAEAVEVFGKMRETGFEPDEMTLVSVLAACGDLGDLKMGKWIEEVVTTNGMELNSYIGSALVNMYGKCGELESARRVFDGIARKEVVIWNAMITGYSQNGQAEETLSLFNTMLEIGSPDPNEITLIEVLSACASIGALDLGTWVDEFAIKRGLHSNIYVATALVDMYSKCGNLERASQVFKNMPQKNEVSWNAMISAHAFNGRAEDALALFQSMLEDKHGARPNCVTFIKALSACVHAGLVEEGRTLFNLMTSSFNIIPRVEHYSCMVDLLSRAGLVSEAWELVQKMPQKPDEIVLGSLLGACQKLQNISISEKVIELLLEIEPENSGNYIISSKIYADMRRWDDCAKMRILMRQKGIAKTPGCSWIEMDGRLREFHAGDSEVEDGDKICQLLGILHDCMGMEDDENRTDEADNRCISEISV